jgi:regulatory protein YycH of two-component signal transduction system YycFG
MNSDEDFEREQRMQMSMREEDSIDEAMMPRPSLFKGTEAEIKAYHDSLKRELDKDKEKFKKDYMDFSDDDWREDFENYVADKALQEHFGRFMKDYQ